MVSRRMKINSTNGKGKDGEGAINLNAFLV